TNMVVQINWPTLRNTGEPVDQTVGVRLSISEWPCPPRIRRNKLNYPRPHKQSSHRAVLIVSVIVAAVLLFTTTGYMAPNSGAIFTTNSSCDGTNINIFTTKTDAFVGGGPAHEGAAGLTDGFYYIQVTEPGG